jgi:hypothetical protein
MSLSLKERRQIAGYQGKLVELAEEAVERASGIGGELDPSQLHNVSGIAAGSECVQVVTNFIKYQMGRKPKAWGHGDFGQEVIKHINGLKKKAEHIAGEHAPDEKVDAVWIELCRSFWGYVIRYFKFRDEGGRGNV